MVYSTFNILRILPKGSVDMFNVIIPPFPLLVGFLMVMFATYNPQHPSSVPFHLQPTCDTPLFPPPWTGYYLLVVASSLGLYKLPRSQPPYYLSYKKCIDINKRKHPTFITKTTQPSTFNRTSKQYKKLKSFNHLPLKSYTKHIFLSPFLLSRLQVRVLYLLKSSNEKSFSSPFAPHHTHGFH